MSLTYGLVSTSGTNHGTCVSYEPLTDYLLTEDPTL